MNFKDPWILFLIPLTLGFVVWMRLRQKPPSLRFPTYQMVSFLDTTWKIKFKQLPEIFRLVAIALSLIALAGPRTFLGETYHKFEGIDIVLTIDVSGSMAAEDFTINGVQLNRLQVVKRVVEEFISQRSHDRIGLVAFGGMAYTVSPLTTDYHWLKTNLKRVELGLVEDGTAVGSGIMSSLSRLKNSKAKAKIIILLTDGVNNAGKIDPISAAKAAKALGVKIYTIGAGTKGYAPFPVEDIWGQRRYHRVKIEIDEEKLKQVADLTQGRYFRATDTERLREIYNLIDSLEKTEIEHIGFKEYQELFDRFLALGLAFLVLELILTQTLFMRIP